MRVSYCDDYVIPLPPRHSFPMPKFRALRDLLVREGIVWEAEIVPPEQVAWADLRLVHTEGYLSKLAKGTLTRNEERRMGLPWSPALVKRSRVAVQGTINAGEFALEDGLAGNLAGGTHHAFPDHGEGFCVLNDVGVMLRVLKRAGRLGRALVVDLDVHQGNGTAAIFENDPDVFTFSMHGAKNFPLRKERSDRDVPLEDGLADDGYLDVLASELPAAFDVARPDLVVYVQGVDVVAGDKFGRLELSREGVARRDGFVIDFVSERGAPLLLLLGGGYAESPEATADLHAQMHREAARRGLCGNGAGSSAAARAGSSAGAQPNRPAT